MVRRVFCAFLLLSLLFLVRPARALAPALAAIPAASLGAVVLSAGVVAGLAATVMCSPSSFDALPTYVDSAGNIARTMWAINSSIYKLGGSYLYGKAVTAWGQVQDMIDYIKSLPNQFSSLISAIDAASQPQGSSVVQTGSVVYVPDVGWFQIGNHKSGIDRYCVPLTSLPGWNGYVVGGPWDYIAYFGGSGSVGFMSVAGDPGTAGCFSGDVPVDVDVWYSSATSPPAGQFDPSVFSSVLDVSDPAVVGEIEGLIAQRPDFFSFSDTDNPADAISGVAAPAVDLPASDVVSALSQMSADRASELADNIAVLAAQNPNDPLLQADAARAAAQADQIAIDAAISDSSADVPVKVDTSKVESKLDDIIDLLTPPAVLPSVDPGDYDSSVPPVVEDDLQAKLRSLTDLAPGVSALSNSSVQISNVSPVVTGVVMGSNISIDMSVYESYLDFMGNFLLSVVTIGTIFMVIRG